MYTGTQEDSGRDFAPGERVVSAAAQTAIGGVVGGGIGGLVGGLARRGRVTKGTQTIDDIRQGVDQENTAIKTAHSIANSRSATGQVGDSLGGLTGRLVGHESAPVRGAKWAADKLGHVPVIGPGISNFAEGITRTAGGAARKIAPRKGTITEQVSDIYANATRGAGDMFGHTIRGKYGDATGLSGASGSANLAKGKVAIGIVQDVAGLGSGLAKTAAHGAGGAVRRGYRMFTSPNVNRMAKEYSKGEYIPGLRSDAEKIEEVARRGYAQGRVRGDGKTPWAPPPRDHIQYPPSNKVGLTKPKTTDYTINHPPARGNIFDEAGENVRGDPIKKMSPAQIEEALGEGDRIDLKEEFGLTDDMLADLNSGKAELDFDIDEGIVYLCRISPT